ncbi:hypothetical protein DCAR_0310962 [Daucus carota subsp. sativus]|uniref:Uncharacterized protein n=1 Tax=Daucus carota subsp. sativus TaxID=79200 RepID=A0A166AAL0_DAUCS|nr:hypothetical protein DCAR_0310962 [Daucus carota subsp. sativus]
MVARRTGCLGCEFAVFDSSFHFAEELGTNEEIVEFACITFKAEYHVFDKVKVNGSDANPLFTSPHQSSDHIHIYTHSGRLGPLGATSPPDNSVDAIEDRTVTPEVTTTLPSRIIISLKDNCDGMRAISPSVLQQHSSNPDDIRSNDDNPQTPPRSSPQI